MTKSNTWQDDRNAYQKARQKLVSRQKQLEAEMHKCFEVQLSRYGMPLEDFIEGIVLPAFQKVKSACVENGWTTYQHEAYAVWQTYANSYPIDKGQKKLRMRVYWILAVQKVVEIYDQHVMRGEEFFDLLVRVARTGWASDISTLIMYLKWRDAMPKQERREQQRQQRPTQQIRIELTTQRQRNEAIAKRKCNVPQDSPPWYVTLGVDENTTDYFATRKAYQVAARATHGDLGGDELKFRQVCVAWEVAREILGAEGLIPDRYVDAK